MAVAHGPRALRGYRGGLGVKIAASGHRNGLASRGILSGKNSRDERVRCARSATVASLIARRDEKVAGELRAFIIHKETGSVSIRGRKAQNSTDYYSCKATRPFDNSHGPPSS
jgi:hypothetical protein